MQNFTTVLQLIKEAFFKHGDENTLKSCIKALAFAANESQADLQDSANQILKETADDLLVKVRSAITRAGVSSYAVLQWGIFVNLKSDVWKCIAGRIWEKRGVNIRSCWILLWGEVWYFCEILRLYFWVILVTDRLLCFFDDNIFLSGPYKDRFPLSWSKTWRLGLCLLLPAGCWGWLLLDSESQAPVPVAIGSERLQQLVHRLARPSWWVQ